MICMGDNDSVGEDNPYGHPTVQTLNALQQHGLPYVRLRYTDGQGALKPLTRGLIHVSVKGGTLLGLGNGCPYNDTGYLTSSTDTYYGESWPLCGRTAPVLCRSRRKARWGRHRQKSHGERKAMTMSRTGKQGPWQAVVRCWKAHPRIAQFITYLMVGNLATVVQLVLIPVLQPILGSTSLVNVDLYLFGPIGDPQTMTTVTAVGQTVSGLNPYYVFNFTGGPVNTLVTRTLNGITGSYLTHGGVAYFLATFIPLILSQVVSFFLQRKVTFKSSGNIAWQAMWYFAAFLVITVGANALYGIYQPWLYSTLGEAIGGLIAAFLQCCIAFWVFFPIMKLIFLSQKKA